MGSSIVVICNDANDFCITEDTSKQNYKIIPIASKDALDSTLKDETLPSNIIGIIIQVELRWGSYYYSEKMGYDILKRIRRDPNSKNGAVFCKLPIILTSFFPKTEFGTSSSFFKDPALKFIPLKELESQKFDEIVKQFPIPPLDDLLFLDIRESIYRSQGNVGEIIHDLLTRIEAGHTNDELREKLDDLQKVSIEAFGTKKTTIREAIASLNSRFFELEPPGQKEALYQFQIIVGKIRNEPSSSGKSNGKILKVLQIDDRPSSRLRDKFLDHGIELHQTQSYKEATEILNQYSIEVVLCDYRFYDADGKFSRLQGLHIAEKLSKSVSSYLGVILLTNFPPSSILLLQNYSQVAPNAFYKRDLDDPWHFRRFVEIIRTKQDKLNRIKNLEFFKKSRNGDEAIKIHLDSPDIYQAEKTIAEFAEKVVDSVYREFSQNGRNSVYQVDADSFGKVWDKIKSVDRMKKLQRARKFLMARRAFLLLAQLPKKFFFNQTALDVHNSILLSVVNGSIVSKTSTLIADNNFSVLYLGGKIDHGNLRGVYLPIERDHVASFKERKLHLYSKP